jgi:hypothetical protein
MLPKYLKDSTFSSCFWCIIIFTGNGCLETSDCSDRNIPAFTRNSKEGINGLTLKYRLFKTRAAPHTGTS